MAVAEKRRPPRFPGRELKVPGMTPFGFVLICVAIVALTGCAERPGATAAADGPEPSPPAWIRYVQCSVFQLSVSGSLRTPPAATRPILGGVSVAEHPRKRGPAPGATREEVVERARADFLACRRIDVQAIAGACGIGRATLYRWFGSREQLIGEAMFGVVGQRMAEARALAGGHGAPALLDTLDLVYRGLSAAPHVRAFIEQDRATALRLMTSSSGPLHPRMVDAIRALIDDEVDRGDYTPPTDPATLAYVLVRLAEGLLFNYADDDMPKDLDRMREVVAALLGTPPGASMLS